MNPIMMRIVLSSILLLSFVSSVQAANERRIALVIGNSNYAEGRLKNPANDAEDMSASLRKLGFDVVLKKDAKLQTMDEAIRNFGDRLKLGGVGLFYYAGHGVQIGGRNYLIPVGSNIRKETDSKYKAIDAEIVIDEMANAGNSVNIIMLDACRDNPFRKSYRSAARGLAIISSAPKGMIISYSTSPGKVASDGTGRNSPYTSALIKNMSTPDVSIEEVFKKVRQELGVRTDGQQVPWELSSLEGNFTFLPTKGRRESSYEKESKSGFNEEARNLEEEKLLAQNRMKLEEHKDTAADLTASPSNYIRRLNAKIDRVDFYEGPYESPEKKDRGYRSSFPKTSTRLVWWELTLSYPALGRKIFFDIETIWYWPDGTVMRKQTRNEQHVEPTWTNSYYGGGFGWRVPSPNTWKLGVYRVDFFVEGEFVARGKFTIRD